MSELPAKDAFYGLPAVPLHKRMGIVFERGVAGAPSISLPPMAELTASDRLQPVAALFTLAEVASGVEACDATWPQAAELGMVAVLVTAWSSFRPRNPARGTIRAVTTLVSGLDRPAGESKPLRKASVEVSADLLAEDGESAGEFRGRYYARFMPQDRVGALPMVSGGAQP